MNYGLFPLKQWDITKSPAWNSRRGTLSGICRARGSGVEYRCCTRERVEATLISLGREELGQIVEEGKDIHIECQFCDTPYVFTPDQVRVILENL